ncbi:RidA family protein [Rhodopseudomonas sp. RCAM05734]|uniref:RidA family protein n=1 Tax=Rhodopseudomonas sp. RCAM05734 TaxID=3457549 RepID=UPI004044B3C1
MAIALTRRSTSTGLDPTSSVIPAKEVVMLSCLRIAAVLSSTLLVSVAGPAQAEAVKIIPPVKGGITPSGSWSVGARAGDFIFVGGMRGVDPATSKLVEGDEARIRQMFINMKQVAEAEGATLQDAVRLTIYVSDVVRYRPLVNKVQEDLWGKGPYPPRTVLEVRKLDQDDIAEVDATFYAPAKKN